MSGFRTSRACAVLLSLSSTTAFAGGNADLLASKTGPDTAIADGDITYTIGVANAGPDAASSVSLDDVLPAGLTFVSIAQANGPIFTCTDPGTGNNGTVSCTLATLAAGTSAEFTLVAHVPAGTPDGSFFTNIATVTTATFDPNDKNNAATAGTALPAAQADLRVQKLAPSSAGPDTDLQYTLMVGNAGPDDAIDVQVIDVLPGDLTFVALAQSGAPLNCTTPAAGSGGTVQCTATTYAAGASTELVLTTHVPAGTPSGTDYTNAAQVSGSTLDANGKNDLSTVTTTVSAIDLVASKFGPSTANAGGTLVYTLGIANNGPDTAFGATLSDTLPAALTFVSILQNTGPTFSCTLPPPGSSGSVSCNAPLLGAGASATFTLTAAVPSNAANGTVVTNTATAATASQFDTDSSNNIASVQTTLANNADVGITKTAPATANAGGTLAWTLTASNAGPDAAANVAISDTLPAGTTFVSVSNAPGIACTTPAVGSGGTVVCSATTLASGASFVVTLTAQVADSTPDGSTVGNIASVASSSPPDLNANNDSASADTIIVNRADLGVSKSAPATVLAGNTLAYTLVASNTGPNADSATLTDMLPANTSFVSLTQDSGPIFACTTPAVDATGSVQCTNAAFAPGATASFTLTTRVSATAADGTLIANTAGIDGTRVDANAANDSATASTTISSAADLGITKTAPATVVGGADFVYTIIASNAGPLADAATFTDTLPAGITFVSLQQNSGDSFTCSTPAVGAGGSVSCTQAAFASNASASFALTVNVPGSSLDGALIANTASIDGTRADTNAGNDSATATSTVSNQPNLVLAKAAPPQVQPGASITYTLDVSNTGNSPALEVVLTDTLPAATRFVSLTQNSGPVFACTTPAVGAGGTVACTLPAFVAGGAARFTLVVSLLPASGVSVTNSANVTTTSADAAPADNVSAAGTLIGFGSDTAPIAIPMLSWFGLLALAAAIALLGAAMTLRAR